MSRYVQGVPLPKLFAEPETEVTTVSGWGTTSITGGVSEVLLEVTIPIISDQGEVRGLAKPEYQEHYLQYTRNALMNTGLH